MVSLSPRESWRRHVIPQLERRYPSPLGCLAFEGRETGIPLVAVFAWGQGVDRTRRDGLAAAQSVRALENFREYLSLPNDAHSPEDIRKILDWMEAALRERGFDTRELPTEGSPLLFAERSFEGSEKTVLVYFDGPPHISGRPTLKFGARGIATFTLTVFGPRVPVAQRSLWQLRPQSRVAARPNSHVDEG